MLFLVGSMSSCFYGGNSNEVIEGLYINSYEPNAIHLIKIKDSTYVHYYKGDFGEFKQEERWTKYQDDDEISVFFEGWEFYGEQTRFTQAKRLLFKGAEIKNGEILMDPYAPKRMNFYKVYK